MKALATLILLTATAAHAETIQCQSIRDITGKAVTTGKITFDRRTGANGKFADDRYSYFFELSDLGIFVHMQEAGAHQEVIVKANFPEAKPYFDLILPLPAKGKSPAVDMEVECRPLKD